MLLGADAETSHCPGGTELGAGGLRGTPKDGVAPVQPDLGLEVPDNDGFELQTASTSPSLSEVSNSSSPGAEVGASLGAGTTSPGAEVGASLGAVEVTRRAPGLHSQMPGALLGMITRGVGSGAGNEGTTCTMFVACTAEPAYTAGALGTERLIECVTRESTQQCSIGNDLERIFNFLDTGGLSKSDSDSEAASLSSE